MQLKVLYLDDEKDLCDVFNDLFSSDSIQILTLQNPDLLQDVLEKEAFDLIFLDFRLPGTTGDQIALQLKTKAPLFLITGEIFLKTQFSFTDIFIKPYEVKKIQECIESYLNKRRSA